MFVAMACLVCVNGVGVVLIFFLRRGSRVGKAGSGMLPFRLKVGAVLDVAHPLLLGRHSRSVVKAKVQNIF